MTTNRVFTGAPWESKVGYCRAVKAGKRIYVSGTASIDEDGQVFAPDDGYRQARRSLEIIEEALQELGGGRKSVVRTRMFVTDIARWEEFGRAHAEFFAEYPPATSMVEVRSLVHKDMLVEIEADAVLGEES